MILKLILALVTAVFACFDGEKTVSHSQVYPAEDSRGLLNVEVYIHSAEWYLGQVQQTDFLTV